MMKKTITSVDFILLTQKDYLYTDDALIVSLEKFENDFHPDVVHAARLDRLGFLSKNISFTSPEDLIEHIISSLLPVLRELGATDAPNPMFTIAVPIQSGQDPKLAEHYIPWILERPFDIFVRVRFDGVERDKTYRCFYYSPTKNELLPKDGVGPCDMSSLVKRYLNYGYDVHCPVVEIHYSCLELENKFRDYFA